MARRKNTTTEFNRKDRNRDRVDDLPTALIAPDDYQHIFSRNRLTANNTATTAAVADDDSLPTAMIAPEDYQHIFSNAKRKQSNAMYDSSPRYKTGGTQTGTQTSYRNVAPLNTQCSYRTLGQNTQASFRGVAVGNNNTNNNNQLGYRTLGTQNTQASYRTLGSVNTLHSYKTVATNNHNKNNTGREPCSPTNNTLYNRRTRVSTMWTLPRQSKTRPSSERTVGRPTVADLPTALIGPEDYQHIYTNTQTRVNKETSHNEDNLPTALIGPDDYQHIYTNTTSARTVGNKATPEEMDTLPTYLVGPDDYQHIYHNNNNKNMLQRRKSNHTPDRYNRNATVTQNTTEDADDMPTCLIAPADYVHIYKTR